MGLAVGDAVGTTLEFRHRGTFEPITDMEGGGPFCLKAGEWTDDTSMALCLADSLIKKQAFSLDDQLMRYSWWADHGYLSSNGECFDIGNTTWAAIQHFKMHGTNIVGQDDNQAGNGSIMRLAPVLLAFEDFERSVLYAGESSSATHNTTVCIHACRLLGWIIATGIRGGTKAQMLSSPNLRLEERIKAIAEGSYRKKHQLEIKGSGFVVQSLEAALWAFYITDTFRDCILAAANLGDDADTTAAVAGQIAGAFYGESGIPQEWLAKLALRDKISAFADKLIELEL